jgi:hypothetical protein
VTVTLDALAPAAAACSAAEACINGRCDSSVAGMIDFRGDWETGDYSQWAEISYDTAFPFQDQLRVVTAPEAVRQGRYAARFAIPAATTKDKIQAEWDSDETAGDEHWYAWSTLFPSDWREPLGYGEILRWTSAEAIPPVIRFNARADTMTLLVQSGDTDGSTFAHSETTLLLDSLHKGLWNDFIVHIRWSADADGTIQVWHRAEGESAFTRRACLRDIPTVQRPAAGPLVHHVRQGLNRDHSSFENVLFHDGFRRGSSAAAVAADFAVTFAPDVRCP